MSQNKIFTKFISIPIFFFVFSFVFFLFSCSFSLLESVNNDQIVNSQTSSQDLQDVTSVSICPKFNSTSEQTSLSSRSAYPAFSESEISSLKFVMIYNKTLISSGNSRFVASICSDILS